MCRLAVTNFSRDNCFQLAAAVSYYTIFSIAPLLFIVVAVLGLIGGDARILDMIHARTTELINPQAADFITGLVQKAYSPRTSLISSLIGFGALLVTATTFMLNLKRSLNIIWNVSDTQPGGIKAMLKDRLRALVFILGFGLLLFASLVADTALVTTQEYLLNTLGATGLQRLGLAKSGATFLLFLGLFTALFKLLPDAHVSWKDTLVGALLTTLLFLLGKVGIGYYLGRTNLGVYGPASTAIAFLLWVNYSALILFLGAEFTQAYAKIFGSDIKAKHAQPGREFEERAGKSSALQEKNENGDAAPVSPSGE